jgi:hypothetical protein
MGIKIIYFGLPGRAEVARLLLTVGKVDFVDERIEREAWAEIKPKVPFGQLPVAEVDGKYLAQSAAIDDNNVFLSGRNIPKVNITTADEVNTYDLINAEILLISETAVSKLENILNK